MYFYAETESKSADTQQIQHLSGVVQVLSDRYDALFRRHSTLKMEQLNSALQERSGYVTLTPKASSLSELKAKEKEDQKPEPKPILPPSKYAPKPASATSSSTGNQSLMGARDEGLTQNLSPQMQEMLQHENLVLQTSLDTMVNQIRYGFYCIRSLINNIHLILSDPSVRLSRKSSQWPKSSRLSPIMS